jgi:hypothetical protein
LRNGVVRLLVLSIGSAAFLAGAGLIYLAFPLSSRLPLSDTYAIFLDSGPSFALLCSNVVVVAILSTGVVLYLVRRIDAPHRSRLDRSGSPWRAAKAMSLATGWHSVFWIYPTIIMSSAIQHIHPLELADPVGGHEIDLYFAVTRVFLLVGLAMAIVDAIASQRWSSPSC